MGRVRRSRVALLLAALAALPGSPLGQSADEPLVSEYVRALGLAASGSKDDSLALLGRLVEDNPAWITAHHGLARVALSAGEELGDTWRQKMFRRVRRSRRDVGASIAYAVFLDASGRTEDAHRLLLSALMAGARSPLLPDLLLDTSPDPEGLADWLARRASVLPGDARFGATRAAVLLTIGRAERALRVIDAALDEAPQDPELLVLRTQVLRAVGRETEGCGTAQLAAGVLASFRSVPEIGVPMQLALARSFIACGRLDDAQRLVTSVGSLVVPPGTVDLAASVSAVAAELELAREQPLRALERLVESRAIPVSRPDEPLESPRDLAQAVLLQAHGLLDLKAPDAAGVVAAPLPAGVALVERSLALAALSLAADGEIDGLGRSQLQASDAMLGAGLTRRARRLRVLAAYTLRDPGLLPARPGTGGESRDPTLTAAISLTAAMIAWEEGNARDALRASTPAPLDVAGAPGRLLAAMRVVAAKAALALDDAEAALAATRDGSLDLQEADRSQQPVPPELRPLVARAASSGDLAVELAGLAFRAAIGAGSSVDDATSALLGDVSRALRGWSTLPASWPTTTGALESVIPEDACLVVSTGIGGEDSVALRRDATPHVGARAGISSAGPCATAGSILWLGPARAPGGLTPAPRDERPLVRVVGLAASGAPAGSKGGHRRPERVGPGRPRPFRTLVERLSGELSDSSESPGAARHAGWPVFAGRGVRSSRCPLSSGWLVPSSGLASEGWIGPESIGPYLGDVSGAGEGLVALGLASFGASDPERGAWVLAEAAHEAGRHWSLFSRMPLADEEIEIVERHLPGMAADLPEGLRRLIADAPQLSRKLDLWTLPDRWHSTARRPLGRGTLLLLVGGASLAAVVLTGLLLRTAWRRRRVSAARRRSR